ncbi:MAG TPA: tetratricopeptide repeat protein [Ktedonobacterales bacterium]|nr:tetratricopeptide repeat protein [Ktedonobacterales bacterium]
MREKTTGIQSWRARGAALAEAQRYDEANAAYDKALELAPANAVALSGNGWVAEQQDRDEDALRYFERALASDPEYTYAARHRALALARLDLLEEAVDASTRVLELDRRTWRCGGNKCGSLYRLTRYDDALDTYDKAHAIAPDNAMLWCDKASTFIKVDRYQNALECADRAIQQGNADAITLNTKGHALATFRKPSTASPRPQTKHRRQHTYGAIAHTWNRSLGATTQPWQALTALSSQSLEMPTPR